MTSTLRRSFTLCFVLTTAIAGLAIPAPAQAQSRYTRAAEGSHVWGADGWCYVIQGGRPVRTTYSRVFPDRRNPAVYDLYDNGRFVRRVGQPATAVRRPATAQRQPSAEVELQGLIARMNQEVAAARTRMPAATAQQAGMPGCPAVRGPFMAANVRVNIPMAGQCMTPEEKRWNNQQVAAAATAQQMRQLGTFCEQRRASGPYAGITPEQQARGQVADGWVNTMTGPQLKTCY